MIKLVKTLSALFLTCSMLLATISSAAFLPPATGHAASDTAPCELKWKRVDVPNVGPLRHVAATGRDDVWSMAAYGKLHWNGRTWSETVPLGDAPAFGRVLNHFQVIRDAVAAEEGGVVKTMGDAVMAVFRRPVHALRAMQQAQDALANPPNGMSPLALKDGIHSGTCIAVTLNSRFDYFGSNVNIAAESFQTRLRGYQDPINLWRIEKSPDAESLPVFELVK